MRYTMKKILITICLLVFTVLSACSKVDDNKSKGDFKVISATGAPGLALAQMFSANNLNYESINFTLEYKAGANDLAAAFGNGSAEAIVAPTNLGAKFYNSNGNYIYAANITWGNIYLATQTDSDFNLEYLTGKTVYTFRIGSVPYIVLQNVLEEYDVTLENLGDSTSATQAKLIQNPSSIVMIAEPVLTVTKLKLQSEQQISNIKQIDIQKLYGEKNNTNNFPQAGIFIKKDIIDKNEGVVKYFLEKLKISCEFANNNPSETVNYAKQLSELYSQPVNALISAMPNSNIRYTTALDSKISLEKLFNIVLSNNAAALGGKLPNNDFYYS